MDVIGKIKSIYGENIAGRDEGLINLYWSWYKGFNEAFHQYRVYNGENYIYLTKKSLQMAKKVSETWADLLINEKCDVVINEKAKVDLDVILDNTKFWTKANRTVELAFALGYGALVGEISADKKMRFVTMDARHIIPLKIENDTITEVAFYKTLSSGKLTRLVIWMKDENGDYVVHTNDYDKDGKAIETNVFNTKSKIPLFMVLKPNIVENNERNNYGISVFANSIDTLKAIDTKYDGFDFEFIGGRKKVYVSVDAMKVVVSQDGESTRVKPFDPLDSVYYNTGDVGADGKPLIQEGGGELRAGQYIEALNFELGLLSEKTGLGYGYFKFDSTGFATATQVVSENSDLFRTLQKHEILVRDELIPFLTAVIEYSNLHCDLKVQGHNVETDVLDILFDDSIIEDKETQKANDRALVDAGLMTYVDYAKKWEAMDDEDARQKYEYLDITKRATTLLPLIHTRLITPEKAIELIYGKDYQDKEKLLEYFNLDDLNIDDGEFDEDTEE